MKKHKISIEIVDGTCQLCAEQKAQEGQTAYFVGLIFAKDKRPSKLWPVCLNHVESAIDIFGKQAFGTTLWPVVCNLDKTVIYNSFKADQDGISMQMGWQEYKAEKKL